MTNIDASKPAADESKKEVVATFFVADLWYITEQMPGERIPR